MKHVFDSFSKKRVLVIGDTMLDVYMHGKSHGTGLKTTVPRVDEEYTTHNFGGCALVVTNLLELGAHVDFISVVGNDEAAKLYSAFTHPHLTKHFLIDPTRRTTVKRRIFADGTRVLHFNSVDNHYIAPALQKKILALASKLIKKADVVALEDPQHGVMPKALVQKLIVLTRKHRTPMFVDPQVGHRPSNHHFYRGAHTMFLNDKEAKSVDGEFSDVNLLDSLKRIQKNLRLENVVVKLGNRGSAALIGDQYLEIPVHNVNVVDPVGAGCSYLAAAALGDLASAEETLKLASVWAALSTTVQGTAPPKRKELLKIVKGARAW